MDFEYNHWEPVYKCKLEINDIGNCAIEASNDDGFFFYLVIVTLLGETVVVESGPSIPDIKEPLHNYTCKVSKLDYDQDKLEGGIFKFLNDGKKKITEAKVITFEDAVDQITDVGSYLLENFAKLPDTSNKEEKSDEDSDKGLLQSDSGMGGNPQ